MEDDSFTLSIQRPYVREQWAEPEMRVSGSKGKPYRQGAGGAILEEASRLGRERSVDADDYVV